MDSKWAFLKSRRFWGLVIIAILKVLESQGIWGTEIVNPLILLISGFIGIRTVDRFAEKFGANE